MDYAVEVIDHPKQDTVVVRGRVPHGEVGPFIVAALADTARAAADGPITGPPFCRIDMDGDDFVLEAGFPVARPMDGDGRVEGSSLPAGRVARLVHTGPYDSVGPAYAALDAWLGQNALVPDGTPWEQYLDGPEVAEPRTVVCWPCAEALPGP